MIAQGTKDEAESLLCLSQFGLARAAVLDPVACCLGPVMLRPLNEAAQTFPIGRITMVRVLLAFLVMAGQHAQAAETAAIQLSCHRPNGPNEGLVVNLAAGTVSAFGVVAHIERADDTSISFNGEGPVFQEGVGPGYGKRIGTMFVAGDLDRITGALWVQMKTECPAELPRCPFEKDTRMNFSMVCRVLNRLF
jgi:hypothetical protein